MPCYFISLEIYFHGFNLERQFYEKYLDKQMLVPNAKTHSRRDEILIAPKF